MSSFLFTVASFLVALGVLITVHEFGHFWVARKLGVKVLCFSIGFGKPLWRRTGKVDGTEYVVASIPLGGYVKMLDEREGEVAEAELDRAFNRQSLPVRSAIVAAGPLFNFLFAFLAYWMIFVSGETGLRPLVGEVDPDKIAAEVGIKVDDELVSVGSIQTPTWEKVVDALLAESMGDGDIPLTLKEQDGYEQTVRLPAISLNDLEQNGSILNLIGITPKRPVVPPLIGDVLKGEAADKVGLRSGDLILSADGIMMSSWSALVDYIQERPKQLLKLEIDRKGEIIELELVTGSRQQGGIEVGRIGASVNIPDDLYDEYRVEVQYGPIDAAGEAVKRIWNLSGLMLKMVGKMIIGEASVDNLSGPISIAESAGKSASFGFVYFLKFLAVVSISLGVLNLLPIPILDGGHLLYFLIEAVKGSPLSESVQLQAQKIGILLLLALMSLAFYVDISRLLK